MELAKLSYPSKDVSRALLDARTSYGAPRN